MSNDPNLQEPDAPDADEAPPSPLAAIVQFFLVPLAVVILAVTVFLVFGYMTHETKGLDDYLQDVRVGKLNRRGQAAYELSLRVAADPEAARKAGVGPAALALFQDPTLDDPAIKRYLVLVLGALRDPSATETLVGALKADDRDTRKHACFALAAIADPAAVDGLVELAKREEDAEIKKVAIYALGKIGDARAVPQLEVAMDDPNPAISWQAAFSLAECGDPSSRALLRRLLDPTYVAATPRIQSDEQTEIRLNAVRALARVAESADLALFADLGQRDPDLKVRDAALKAATALAQPTPAAATPTP